jgi:lipocalin-like protein
MEVVMIGLSMRKIALLLVLVASPAIAQESALIGNWKLVAFQNILDNDPPKDMFGARPKGVLILTREGRMAAIITAETRKAGVADAERAELHKSMIAYSGKYRVNGKEFVTTVEMSWNEAWNGTEQKRYWKIEDGKLFIETAPQPSPDIPGRTAVGRLVWERDK